MKSYVTLYLWKPPTSYRGDPSSLAEKLHMMHQIDFVPSSSLPNLPAYKANLKQSKEIQRQVTQLHDKGLVRESLCPMPVILVPKKDGT
ncbi:hypothetical protein CR513_26289, partial [Mucuna pruriens]